MAPGPALGHRDSTNPRKFIVSDPWRFWVLSKVNRVADLPDYVLWNPVGLPEVKLVHLHVKPRPRILKSPTHVIGPRASRRLSRSVWDHNNNHNNIQNNNNYNEVDNNNEIGRQIADRAC